MSRQAQKENTRKLIMQAAYGEFCVKGILATRMEDVARAAGVSHGTVFLHFATQEALVSAVIGEYCGRIAQRTHELAEGDGGVRFVLAAHLAGVEEYELLYTRLVVELPRLPDACRSAFVGVQSAVAHHLGQAAEREMASGTIKPMPIHLLFNGWVGLLHYYLANGELFAPGESVVARCGEELLNHYMKLISAKG